jgi:hypothetical protein
MRKNCVIITGKQSKEAHDCINKITRFLNADIFLIYETDGCNYINHPNLIYSEKIINKATRRGTIQNVNLQYENIERGWHLMENYEEINKFQYENVFRIRPDIRYNIFKEWQTETICDNKVFLNSDIIFYGKRNLVKHCFFLKNNWYKLKSNRYNSLIEEVEFKYILETFNQDNSHGCFSANRSENWFCNKLLSIPIPSKTTIIRWDKDTTVRNFSCLLEEGIKDYKEAIDKGYDIKYLPPGKDKSDEFSCELSILLVLLYNKIIPAHSKFIVANEKLI